MPNNYEVKKSTPGLCCACGKSTKLPIHEHCGEQALFHKKRRLKPYTESQITAILKGID